MIFWLINSWNRVLSRIMNDEKLHYKIGCILIRAGHDILLISSIVLFSSHPPSIGHMNASVRWMMRTQRGQIECGLCPIGQLIHNTEMKTATIVDAIEREKSKCLNSWPTKMVGKAMRNYRLQIFSVLRRRCITCNSTKLGERRYSRIILAFVLIPTELPQIFVWCRYTQRSHHFRFSVFSYSFAVTEPKIIYRFTCGTRVSRGTMTTTTLQSMDERWKHGNFRLRNRNSFHVTVFSAAAAAAAEIIYLGEHEQIQIGFCLHNFK